MSLSPKFTLFKEINDPEYGYWLTAECTYNIDLYCYLPGGSNFAGNIPDEEGNYSLKLLVENTGSGGSYVHPLLYEVHLGPLNNPQGTAEIKIDIICGSNRVGGGQVKLADAEQTSKPLPVFGENKA